MVSNGGPVGRTDAHAEPVRPTEAPFDVVVVGAHRRAHSLIGDSYSRTHIGLLQ